MLDFYSNMADKFPIISIEDPMDEHDWEGFSSITKKLGTKLQIVGDDLFVTNTEFVKKGVNKNAANAVLIKLNQIGTVSETIATIQLCQKAGWNYEWDFSEDFQYTVYPKGGFYGWHTDQGMSCSFGRYKYDEHNFDEHKESLQSTIAPCIIENPTNLVDLHNKIRKLSVTLTLSEPDQYTGGNLEFDEGEFGRSTKTNRYTELTQIRPQGSIVVFPSYQWHQIKEVKSGIRKSLVLWSCGPPFR